MNVSFLWNWPINEFTGGVGIVTKILAKEMQARGHKVIFIALITHAEKARNAQQLKSIGMNQDTYPYVAPQYYVDAALPMPQMVKDMEKILEQNAMDMVIVQDLVPEAMDVLQNLSVKYQKIIIKHSQPFEAYQHTRNVYRGYIADSLSKKLWKTLVLMIPAVGRMRQRQLNYRGYQKAIESADRLCLLSSGFITRLLHFMPTLDRHKLCYINNPNTFACSQADGADKEKLVVMVCRLLESTKNITHFMQAWQSIEQQHPDWRAEVVGDGPDRQMLEHRCQQLGLRSLSFVGYQSQVESYYKRAQMVCVTSWYEGWPMVICEGMAHGCVPIVYDTYESIRDIFDDEESGLIVKSCQPQELFQKLDGLMKDNERWQALSNRAIVKVKQFEPSKIVEEWEKLYQEIKQEKNV